MSETAEKNEVQRIRISVRNLVEFILRSGDIDNRHGGPADRELMQEGSRLHRKIQGKMGSNYRAEVPLAMELVCDGFILSVEGRADGIFLEDELTCIDEIKGSYRDLAYLREPVPVHLAQAMCYAYIYASQHDLPRIGVQMTYCHLETEEIRRFQQVCETDQLEAWFRELTGQYEKWARYQIEWKQIRQESVRKVTFPFEWRPGQKKVSQDVYRTILRRKKLFIQAPTGTGKTISTVFPAVKALGEGLANQIFYMTAKTITRTVAQEAFQVLKGQGLRMKVLTLTAKEKICFCEEAECNPDACPYAKGHFDRVNDAVFEMITSMDSFSREAITAQAEKWQVCPFEFSLDLSLWMDAIICDYNYVFDPQARLKRFFADGVKGDYLFLIDEAHNLVERGREMFSASLYKEDFLELKKTVKPVSSKMARALERCNKYLLAMKRETDGLTSGDVSGFGSQTYRVWKETGMLPVHLMNLCGVIESFLEDVRSGHPARGMDAEAQRYIAQFPGGIGEINRRVLELYFQVRAFLDVCDRLDDNYVIYTEHVSDGRFMIRLYCVDISKNLQECLERGKSTIFFSATLLPVTYYKSLLSTAKDDYAIYAHSTFDPKNRQVLIGTDTSSRYTNRSVREYRKMARYIFETVRAKRGNYMVFFSSYRMLEDVRDAFAELCEQEQITVQTLTRVKQIKSATGETVENEQKKAGLVESAESGQIKSASGETGENRHKKSAPGESAESGQIKAMNVGVELSVGELVVQTDGENCTSPDRDVTEQITVISQESGMNEHDREWFLEQFDQSHQGSLVGFCVMGGIFGEGIDLKNDRLIGAIIVGTGLPQVCNEREILKRFYDDRKEDGFFYAYLCPGMNKVLQSAGRVIRTEEDKGVILLLDERFAQERYRRMFPAEWTDLQMCTVSTVCQKTEQFWAENADIR